MESTYIYGLLDPETQEIRYVGSSFQPVKRFRAHVAPSAATRGNKTLQEWVAGLRGKGLTPELVILETVEARSDIPGERHPLVAQAEDGWILRLLDEGHNLTNGKIPEPDVKSDDEIIKEAMRRGREMFGQEEN